MGWCPIRNKTAQKEKQPFTFVNIVSISGKIGNPPEFRTSNVLFPANTTLFIAYFIISFNLLLRLKSPENAPLFLAGLLLFNVSYYLLVLKTFNTAVKVDKLGVHIQGFRLKKFEIPYKNIECITSHRLEKHSKKMFLFLIIGGASLYVFMAYVAIVKGDWNVLLLSISLLPLMLFAERKQKTRLGNLNTQLYIKIKYKKWYKWTSYYSIITDETSAAQIKSFISRYCEGMWDDNL